MNHPGRRRGTPASCPPAAGPLSSLQMTQDIREKSLYAQLEADLADRAARSLRRSLTPVPRSGRVVELDGERLINLASNDYLALSQHPHIQAAAKRAIDAEGVGAGASRLITGSLDRHAALEHRFARFKHAEAALLLPTGYMANLAALNAIAGEGDLICLDKRNHASLIDAANMTGATVRTFPHRGYDKLERLLARHATETARDGSSHKPQAPRRAFIVTDTVFSMDGDVADLPRLCALAQQHDAVLIADEAHATGVLGETGAGLCEAQGVTDRVDVVISTASKALGGLGGLVTARRLIIDTLLNHARPAIYTTAAPPAQAAAIDAALDVLEAEPHRRTRLAALSDRLRHAITTLDWPAPNPKSDIRHPKSEIRNPKSKIRHPKSEIRHPKSEIRHPKSEISDQKSEISSSSTPIIPVTVGDPDRALALSRHLRHRGILAPAIRYPTVAPGSDRVRLSLRADLTDHDLDHLIDALTAFAE